MKNYFIEPKNQDLYKISREVKKEDFGKKSFSDIIRKMKIVAGVNQTKDKNKPTMVGLAAPQIGFPYRIVFVDVSANAKRDHKESKNVFMVNPKIISKSKKMQTGREGCYSAKIGDCGVNGIVERNESIKVQYTSLNGERVVSHFGGFTAVIIQHEIDHLDGKVFVHRIKNKKDLHIVFPSEHLLYKKNYKKWTRNLDPKVYFKDIAGIL